MTDYAVEAGKKNFDLLVLPLFENQVENGIKAYDPGLEPFITKTITKDFEGKKGQTMLLYGGEKYPRLLFIGLGEKSHFTIQIWKQAVGAAVVLAQTKKAKTLGLSLLAETLAFGARLAGEASVVAAEVAQYAFDEHKNKKDRVLPLTAVHFLGVAGQYRRAFEKGMEDGRHIAAGVTLVRVLGNTPPSIMTPSLLADKAVELCAGDRLLRAKVFSRGDMKRLGMGCLLGVSSGSAKEPKFIIVEYHGAAKGQKPTVLVGKGITFDSGGLHLKPEQYMSDMKFDMLGAATVLGVIKAAALLKVKKNLVGLIPACENMPDGDSYRPDDILTAMNGKSVEIVNTDAEGRVILADALSYATMKYQPKEVIDFATLTGACMVALGLERSGLFSSDAKLADSLLESSQLTGEMLWRLPLGEEFTEDMKSEVADYKIWGSSRYGGASTGAAFLEFFTLDPKTGQSAYPWAHIDLSSSYIKGKGKPWIRGGANGFGVQTVIEYLR